MDGLCPEAIEVDDVPAHAISAEDRPQDPARGVHEVESGRMEIPGHGHSRAFCMVDSTVGPLQRWVICMEQTPIHGRREDVAFAAGRAALARPRVTGWWGSGHVAALVGTHRFAFADRVSGPSSVAVKTLVGEARTVMTEMRQNRRRPIASMRHTAKRRPHLPRHAWTSGTEPIRLALPLQHDWNGSGGLARDGRRSRGVNLTRDAKGGPSWYDDYSSPQRARSC